MFTLLPIRSQATISFALSHIFLLAGCDKFGPQTKGNNQRSVAEMNEAVTALDATVKGLESALVRNDAEQPRWGLWQTRQTMTARYLTGPTPPKPLNAFAGKEECLKAARVEVAAIFVNGRGKQVSETSYWQTGESSDDVDRKSTRLNSSHVSQSRMPSSA